MKKVMFNLFEHQLKFVEIFMVNFLIYKNCFELVVKSLILRIYLWVIMSIEDITGERGEGGRGGEERGFILGIVGERMIRDKEMGYYNSNIFLFPFSLFLPLLPLLSFSLETFSFLMALKARYPEKITLLRGFFSPFSFPPLFSPLLQFLNFLSSTQSLPLLFLPLSFSSPLPFPFPSLSPSPSPPLLFPNKEITKVVKLQLCMDFTMSHNKNMVQRMFGNIVVVFLIIFLLLRFVFLYIMIFIIMIYFYVLCKY